MLKTQQGSVLVPPRIEIPGSYGAYVRCREGTSPAYRDLGHLVFAANHVDCQKLARRAQHLAGCERRRT